MREQEEAKRTRLLDAVRLGAEDIEAGRMTLYTSELLNQIEYDARKHAAEGGKPGADVAP